MKLSEFKKRLFEIEQEIFNQSRVSGTMIAPPDPDVIVMLEHEIESEPMFEVNVVDEELRIIL